MTDIVKAEAKLERASDRIQEVLDDLKKDCTLRNDTNYVIITNPLGRAIIELTESRMVLNRMIEKNKL